MTPETVQILFIDIQPEIVANSRTNPPERLTAAAVALARLGTLFDLPMHASVVPAGTGKPRLVPELADALPTVTPLTRTTAPVFGDGPTKAAIAATGRHDLVVCGVVTEVAVLLAAFDGVLAGHEVHVPVDACGGLSQRTEEAAFRRIESFDAATACVATLGAVLAQDLGTDLGRETMAILQTVMR
ncbi:isochorismatase family protein [Marinivivus vitaminiproducens]|uniref:isochorismatase family protein n=1 Tax=Marinivivus vitaminiproducens TaxID=3035935 RepID=UPI00279C7622|nr:isochorismatase family protein [Geminicoccaceae bacterium SCSIO 64248]